jgi:hypothetical protein
MQTHALKGMFRWLFICLADIMVVPPLGLAQPTAPITVVIQFEEPTPARFGGTGDGNLALSTISAAGLTSFTLIDQIALPRVETRTERETEREELTQRLPRRPRTVGGTFRYEHVDFHNDGSALDGNILSTNFQLAWDFEPFSVGFLIPYDYLDLRRFNAHQIGGIVYGQYTQPLSERFAGTITLNGNYVYSAIDEGINDLNTFGGGITLSVAWDLERFLIGGVFSYQYNQDDSGRENNHQHLIKMGPNAGVRIGQNLALNLFLIWNYDITDYQQVANGTDDNYFDLGLELNWSISRLWSLNGGYKKILGLRDFDSNQVFLGTLLRF